MRLIIKYAFIALVTALVSVSCEKEQKKYSGDAQLAFSNNTYSFNVTTIAAGNTTSPVIISIPIQLIAKKAATASGSVSVNSASTCAPAVTISPDFTIEKGNFSYNLQVSLDYSLLEAGKNTLILDLASDMKVAKYYSTATITLTK